MVKITVIDRLVVNITVIDLLIVEITLIDQLMVKITPLLIEFCQLEIAFSNGRV